MESKKLEIVIFSTLFIGISTLIFFVFRPFIYIIVLAAVLSVIFYPLYVKFIKISFGNKNIAASLMLILALVFLIVPILFFGLQISGQAQNFFSLGQIDQSQYMQIVQQNVDSFIQHIVPSFSFNVSDFVNKILVYVSSNLAGFLSQTTYIFFQILFLLFTLFFLLRDGEKMLDVLISLSPFSKEQNKEVADSVYRTINSVIRETLFVGFIRFALISLAFYFFNIPDALLWGTIGGIIGMVPGLGTPFVIIPTVLYLFFFANIYTAIAMALFGILLSVFVDNMLSAYFFGKGLDVPPFFILFAILGGIIFFGPLGFIFGPIILSLFISLIDMYKILLLKK